MKRQTVIPTFTDLDHLQFLAKLDPYHTVFHTRSDHQIVYIENSSERFIAADRWGLPVDTVIAFMDSTGGRYSYTSPAAFSFSLYKKDFAPPGFILPSGDFRSTQARDSVYGGRCEVYYHANGPAHQYDINGSYPYSAVCLSFPDPRSIHYAKPPSLDNIRDYEGMSTVIFSQEGFSPVLPVRYGMRVLFPHADHVTGTYTHTELRYALNHGVTIHSVVKQYIADRVLPDNPFLPFVTHCWEQRKTSEHPALWKQIANSLFGRMSIAYQGLLTFRIVTDFQPARFLAVPSHLRGYFGVTCIGTQSTAPPDANPLWAAMVLSHARARLHSLITPHCNYVDTDCVICSDPLPGLGSRVDESGYTVGAGLGQLKYQWGNYEIKGAKAYRVKLADGKEYFKLKGVSRAHRTLRDFYAAQHTQERILQPDGTTRPHMIDCGMQAAMLQ